MSWTPFRQLAFDIAMPDVEGYWYAVSVSSTFDGKWLTPGDMLKKTIRELSHSGFEGLEHPDVMASEYLCVDPPEDPGKLVIVEYSKDREFEEVAEELDILSQKF